MLRDVFSTSSHQHTLKAKQRGKGKGLCRLQISILIWKQKTSWNLPQRLLLRGPYKRSLAARPTLILLHFSIMEPNFIWGVTVLTDCFPALLSAGGCQWNDGRVIGWGFQERSLEAGWHMAFSSSLFSLLQPQSPTCNVASWLGPQQILRSVTGSGALLECLASLWFGRMWRRNGSCW